MSTPRERALRAHTLHIWFTWLEREKRWVLTWTRHDGRRSWTEFDYVDVSSALDESAVNKLVHAIEMEMHSWLW